MAMLAAVAVGAGAVVLVQREADQPDDWDPRVADLVEFVEQERGLEFDHAVNVNFLTPEEYRETTRTPQGDISDSDREDIDRQTRQLRALGLASGDVDLFEAGNDMADTGTLAFYDPFTEEIVVRGTELDVSLRTTLVHELTHALQDQNFNLDAATRDLDPTDNDDIAEYHAYTALVEGDAMRVEYGYLDQLSADEIEEYTSTYDQELSEAEASLSEVPSILIAVQSAPYALGQPLVEIIAADGGNDAVDVAFTDPPTTAEHMFDAPSYLARDTPTELDDPELPEGATPEDDGPLTAVDLYLLLADRIDPLVALDAADGWGNGRTVTYDEGGQTCVRLTVDGDTDQDDQQLRDALTSWAGAMVPEAEANATDLGGGHILVESCHPGPEVEATNNRALDMLTIPAVRAQIAMSSAIEGADIETAWSAGSCFVHEISVDQLIEANGSAEPDPELMDAITDASAACGG